jgi:hypothetical protein
MLPDLLEWFGQQLDGKVLGEVGGEDTAGRSAWGESWRVTSYVHLLPSFVSMCDTADIARL